MEVGMLTGQVAQELGVSVYTVMGWERCGKLRATRSAGGWRLFRAVEVARIKREMQTKLKKAGR